MMMDPTYCLGQIIRRLKKSSALRGTAHPQSFKEKSETDTIKQESERNRLTDDNVLKAMADFEMRLDENADLERFLTQCTGGPFGEFRDFGDGGLSSGVAPELLDVLFRPCAALPAPI